MLGGLSAAQSGAGIDLHQNWDQKQKEAFWFTPQGSLLLPYEWFLDLEQASATTRFRDNANIERLGYIPAPQSTVNRDGLPIGFTKDSNRAGDPFVGFTCAACHTAKLRIDGTDTIVEGAPTLADFWQFMYELVAALDATATTPGKFAAFASNVLGPMPTPQQEIDLRTQLDHRRADLRKRWLSQKLPTPYGPSRLDAFGGLYNQVVAYHLRVDKNARVPNAPVSYPFLWDTPQHDKVQWNGTADNKLPLGLGPTLRNIGEAIGVFGSLEFTKHAALPKYDSSIKVDNLEKLEGMVRTLRAPMWPLAIDKNLARTGEHVYSILCVNCHAILPDPGDPKRHIKAKMIDVTQLGTDLTFAVSYSEHFADSQNADPGVLLGSLKVVTRLGKFKDPDSGGDIFSDAVLGTYLGRDLRAALSLQPPSSGSVTPDVVALTIRNARAAERVSVSKPAYKARPLDGIWATAPYLHNGSVPTIAELLKRPEDRVKGFWIGSHDLDPEHVGLSVAQVPNAFWFDTRAPGNSNQGHDYGTTLSDDEKKALIEFLKTL